MKFLSRATYLSPVFCLLAALAQSANAQPVVINEVAWMGTQNSYNDEWIELYNNTGSQINLSGWKLTAQDGTPEINLTGNILAGSFFLLERTDDSTVPNVAADQIYTGASGNNGEDLILYDNAVNIVDKVSCNAGWFAGDNQTKQTMERIDPDQFGINPANWQTSQNPGGTPKAKNSVSTETPPAQEEPVQINEPEPEIESPPQENQPTTELPEPQPKEEVSPEQNEETSVQSNPIIYPNGVILNEILPSPEGSDETDEWIEIFNQNSFEVDLSYWKIRDVAGTVTTFTVPSGTKIPGASFLVFERPATKIVLNNDADGVSLIQPDGKIVETITYSKAAIGQSYSRLGSEWFWTSQLTPAAENIIPKSVSRTSENAAENNKDLSGKRELAAAAELVKRGDLFVPLVALAVAFLSAGIILILKTKLNKIKNF